MSGAPYYDVERRTPTFFARKWAQTQQLPLPSDVREQPPLLERQQLLFLTTPSSNARCLQNIIESIVFGWRAIDMARHTFIFIVFVYI